MRNFILISIIILLSSCSINYPERKSNKVLLLKVDYLTNNFEGGKEIIFDESSSTFNISNQYKPPGDFGRLTLIYQEINDTLFDGTIIWSGLGQMKYPKNLLSCNEFETVKYTIDQKNEFQNIFNPENRTYDYTKIWLSIQNLKKVREYLISNPNQALKLFLYTPRVGAENPADCDWIIFIKN